MTGARFAARGDRPSPLRPGACTLDKRHVGILPVSFRECDEIGRGCGSDVHHAGFGVRRAARPVHTTEMIGQGEERRFLPLVSATIGGVNIGPILYAEAILMASSRRAGVKSRRSSTLLPWRSNAGGFVRKGLVAAVLLSPGTSDCGTGFSDDRPDGFAGDTVEYISERHVW